MMMTQSYYSSDYDAFARSNHRAPTAAHYDRPAPYTHGYYEPTQQELRSEYVGRQSTRAMIHEPSSDNSPPGHARRRIQVACSRCRRRKIKCTGDPGDGSGCSACRSAGADRNTCTFIRVGSHQVPVPGIDIMPASSGVQSSVQTAATYGTDATSNSTYDGGLYQNQQNHHNHQHHQNHHRPSLPMLQTRTAYPEYESYNTSPVDDYTYTSAIPRQQSFSSTYGAENFRPWTSGSVSTPSTSTSMYYEPGSAFSFGTLQAAGPFPSTPIGSRLQSVTSDAFSPLNLASLHASLPTQTVQERRLPVPYPQSYQQPNYSSADVPQIRPLGSFSEPQSRPHIHGIHSRNGMPWSSETSMGRSMSRVGSMGGLPHLQPQQQQHYAAIPVASSSMPTSSLTAEVLGYRFSNSTTSASPEVSPTSGPALSETSTATSSMLPPSAGIRYSSNHHNDDHSRQDDPAASLYSYSSGMESAERSTAGDRHSSRDDSHLTAYPPMRHPQPQHAASLDGLRRRSSHDQRSASTHRMSVSNLNGRY